MLVWISFKQNYCIIKRQQIEITQVVGCQFRILKIADWYHSWESTKGNIYIMLVSNDRDHYKINNLEKTKLSLDLAVLVYKEAKKSKIGQHVFF